MIGGRNESNELCVWDLGKGKTESALKRWNS